MFEGTRKIHPWSNPPGKFAPIKFPPPPGITTWSNSLTLNLIQPLTLTLTQVCIHRGATYWGEEFGQVAIHWGVI